MKWFSSSPLPLASQRQEILIYPDGRMVPVNTTSDASLSDADERQPKAFWQQKQFRWCLGLFIATAFSTYFVGEQRYADGLGYMLPVMGILLAHEMGHYLTSVFYRVPASLPFFLPMPFTPLGTMGAVIVKRGGQEDRKALFDIAIAGPLAGLVVAIPVCIYGAMTAVPIPYAEMDPNLYQFQAPPIVGWIVQAVRGTWPEGVVMESAVLDAGWVGIFITALNLIPIGQLDGGHILYCLIRKKAYLVANILILLTLFYMIRTGNATYSLMLFLILMMGPYHPPTANDYASLGWVRIIAGWLTLSFILVGFTPTPIMIGSM